MFIKNLFLSIFINNLRRNFLEYLKKSKVLLVLLKSLKKFIVLKNSNFIENLYKILNNIFFYLLEKILKFVSLYKNLKY